MVWHRQRRRQRLAGLLDELQAAVDRLPPLPDAEQMAWAQAILSHPGSCVLEVDTTGLGPQAELLRLLLLSVDSVDSAVVYDQLIRPSQPLEHDPAALTYNGLTRQQIEQAPSLEEVWSAFEQRAVGRLLISWNWAWDYERLVAACQRLGLGAPALLGLDLQAPARSFFHQLYASLPMLCQQLGTPLPQPATALDRARGQLLILRAMADGRLGPLHQPVQQPAQLMAAPEADQADQLGPNEEDTQPF
jgi:DNA polymerase III alpha subunit (gram-positive type)